MMERWRSESGAEIVEVALAVPLVLTLLVGIITAGRAWNVYRTLTRAAREGARMAVLPACALCGAANYTGQEVFDQFVAPVLESDNLDPKQVTNYSASYEPLGTVITDKDGNRYPPCGIAVELDYPFDFAVPFVTISTISLHAKAVMRMENQPGDYVCPTGSL